MKKLYMIYIIKKFENKNNLKFQVSIFSKHDEIYKIYQFIYDLEN